MLRGRPVYRKAALNRHRAAAEDRFLVYEGDRWTVQAYHAAVFQASGRAPPACRKFLPLMQMDGDDPN